MESRSVGSDDAMLSEDMVINVVAYDFLLSGSHGNQLGPSIAAEIFLTVPSD